MSKKATLTIGVVQLTSNDQLEYNVNICSQYIDKATKDGVNIIFLPENSFSMSREAAGYDEADGSSSYYTMVDHPGVVAAQGWAKQHGVWVVIGSIAVIEGDGQALPYNRSVVIDHEGCIVAHYDKLHLFDVELAGGERYVESARMYAGDKAVMADTPWGGVGLSICYDVRFPHLYRDLALAGAGILSIPAAFTVPTGRAHWHVLQRARAIENGCFVVAAAQCGEHPGGRLSYGHSLVVSPWGEVLLDLGEAPGYGVVELDLGEVKKARETLPNLRNIKEYTLPS